MKVFEKVLVYFVYIAGPFVMAGDLISFIEKPGYWSAFLLILWGALIVGAYTNIWADRKENK